MSLGVVVALAFLLVPLGLSVGRAIRERRSQDRREQRVRGVPRVPIAEAGEGRVTCIVGDLIGAPPLVAPLTGRPCFYWALEIQLGDDLSWNTRVHEVGPATTFTIRDDSGRAIVDCAGAEVVTDRSAGQRVIDPDRWNDERRPAFDALLTRHGLPTAMLARGRYRCVEHALTSADPIAIVGIGVHEPDPDAAGARAYRDGPPTILHLASTRTQRLVITDSPFVT